MKFLNLLTVAVVLVVMVLSVSGEDNAFEKAVEQTLFSIVKVEGQTLTAHTKRQYDEMVGIVKAVNKLKRDRAKQHISKAEYDRQVAILIGNY